MVLFLFICILSLVLVPGLVLYLAGDMVLGPLLWAGRSLRLQGQSRRLLAPGFGIALSPTCDDEVRERLDQVALVSWSSRARDFAGEHNGLRVLVRTQPRTVGADGEPLRFPWTRMERREAQQVLGLSVVIDPMNRLPKKLDLHVALGRDDAVVGDEALAVALLDHGIRSKVSPGDQLTISEQLVGYDSPLGLHRGPDVLIAELTRMTRRLLDATGVDQSVDRAKLLLHNASYDPDGDVRARSVDMLLRRFPETADAAFDAALKDPSPSVRFAAARHLDQDGFECVLEVLYDPKSSDGLRERALRYMLRNFPKTKTVAVLEQIVNDGQGGLRNIAIRHLGELRHQPAVRWMTKLLPAADRRTTIDIATALADIGDPNSEPVLSQLVGDGRLDVQLAAVDALGTVGHLTSVQRLLPLTKSRLTDARLHLAALTAIRMIQARHARTGSGALSMVDDAPTGGLSIATDRGAVSLRDDADGGDAPDEAVNEPP